MNTRIATEYRALRHWGRQMSLNTCHSLDPSSFAASMREAGMRRMDFVSRNTENGANMPGKMMAQRVFRIPSQSLTR